MVKKTSIHWNIPAPKPLDEALEKAIEQESHVSKAEFIRDTVRRKLEEMQLYPLPVKEDGIE